MFKPNNSTITQNMHKVSLQNYATGLPHQRELEWHGPRPPTTPTRSQARGFDQLLQIQPEFAPSVREKRKSSDSLAGICMKQAPGGAGDPRTCCFARSHTTASMPPLRRGPTTHLHPPHFFGLRQKKPVFNGKFPRKLRQSWMTPKGVIRN